MYKFTNGIKWIELESCAKKIMRAHTMTSLITLEIKTLSNLTH